MSAFPTALDTFHDAATLHLHDLDGSPVPGAPGGTLAIEPHSQVDEKFGQAIIALQVKVGIDGSTNAGTIDKKLAGLVAANTAITGFGLNLTHAADAAAGRGLLALGSAALASTTDFDPAGFAGIVQAELDNHIADTTGVHGIADTSLLDTIALRNTAIAGFAPLASPALTGTPTAPDPTTAQGIATKAYVDANAQGLQVKQPAVPVATTANITLSGEQTIDGVTTSASDILVKNQTAPAENGIYTTAAGAWARRADMDSSGEVKGAFVFVTGGTTQAKTGWAVAGAGPFTLGTTAIVWAQFSAAGSYSNGTGLTLTGTVFAIDTSVVVDKTTAQTLTNKTLTAPVLNSPTGLVAADIPTLPESKITNLTSDLAGKASATLAVGGDLTGNLPNPTLATSGVTASTYGDATHSAQIVFDAKGRATSASSVAITGLAESAITGLVSDLAAKASATLAVGGDLAGNLPNPTLATIGSAVGPIGSASTSAIVTIDAKGRVTALGSASIVIAESAVTGLTSDLAQKANLNGPTFTGVGVIPTGWSITAPTGIVKGDVGLGNVDNTSDSTKNAAAVALTNKTGLSLSTGTVSGGTMTGGKIDPATHLHISTSYTQSVLPTDAAIGTAVLVQWNATLNDNNTFVGSQVQTGYFGPRGVFQLEGTLQYGVNQSFEGLGAIGFNSQLIEQNIPSASKAITPSWDFLSGRIKIADGHTVTLTRNDTRNGGAAFIDNALFLTKNTGTMDGTTDTYEIISFVSVPFVMGNTHVTRRVGFDVADLNNQDQNASHSLSDAATTSILSGEPFGSGIDGPAGIVDENIGVRIGNLTRGALNWGIKNAAGYIGWDGDATKGAVKIIAGDFFGGPSGSVSILHNATDSTGLVGIAATGTTGSVVWGPGGSGAADVKLDRTAAGVLTMTGAFKDATFLTSLAHAVTVWDGTATDGAIRFAVANISGPTAVMQVYANSTDTSASVQIGFSAGGNPAFALGVGGTTNPDIIIQRTGTSTASLTGTFTIPAPVITGHATIEGVTPTGATGTGALVFGTSPSFTTPTLGVATATSVNKVALTAPATSATLTIADGKTLTASNTITLAGTDATTMTFPSTSATIARTDAANTFTGTQTFSGLVAISWANGTNPSVTITSTTATSTGGIAFTVGNFITAFPVTSIGVLKAAGDAQPTAGLFDTNGNGSLKLGVGGSTSLDFTLAYNGTAAAIITGTLTMPSPVVTGTASFSAANISTDTTTGLKIGTGTTQKLGFYNATPVVQQLAATDLGTVLSNLGLRVAGTAYPITTSGAVNFSGTVTLPASLSLTTPVLGAATGTSFAATGAITSSGTAGMGYATGAGGTVTQATSKSTGVTLSKTCGQITMNNAALLATTIVSFVLTNTTIAATDVLVLNHISGGTPGAYTLNARAAAGSATIDIRNDTVGSLSEAIVLQFVVVKAVNA